MELYKFINENEVQKYKGGFVVIDNRIYTNPTEETVRKSGYKPLAEVTPPEYNPETHYLSTIYKDGDIITPEYIINEISSEID